MFKRVLLSMVLLITLFGSFSFAEGPLKICVSQMTPNVIKEGNSYTGFDIELWETIAKDIGEAYQYEEVEFSSIFERVKTGEYVVGIGAITIRSDREKLVNFTHHYLDSGLKILIPNNKENGLIRTVRNILTPAMRQCLLYLLLFIVICGHILWATERGKDSAIDDRYYPGIFDSFWCVIATMTTVGYGDIAPKKRVGRLTAFLIMLVGISFFGIIISQMTSTLTAQKIVSNISCPEDLRGKIVATKKGTTSEDLLREVGAKVITFEHIDDAYVALVDGDVKAVLFDSPSVMYFSEHEGKDKVIAVDKLFDKQYYGFCLNSSNTILMEKINHSLLKLRENGEYEKIYNKWF